MLPRAETIFVETKHVLVASCEEWFNNYPWGSVVFTETLSYFESSLKSIMTYKTAYSLLGFPHAVLAWAFETIPTLHVNGFVEKNKKTFPQRVLNWVYDGSSSFKMLNTVVFENSQVCKKFLTGCNFLITLSKFSYLQFLFLLQFNFIPLRATKKDKAQWYMAYFNNKRKEKGKQVVVEEQPIADEKTSDNVIQENSDEEVEGRTLFTMSVTTTIVKKIERLEKNQKVMNQQLDELKNDVKQMLAMMKSFCKSQASAFGSPCQTKLSDPFDMNNTYVDSVVDLARKYVEVLKNLIFVFKLISIIISSHDTFIFIILGKRGG